ncbi:hypothetical protein [Micromonospora okii]|uniref:hypothetical protein n=1 Tax=Micromonospora okii TaxID=1182970 RepID=UPI001E32524A|nr:hypothetical protein [Micromonospora okii]
MTPPLLNAASARIHRRRLPSTPGQVHVDRAEQHRAALARREPVVVKVNGYGRGWYVQAVGASVYELWRDGTTLTVPWTAVPLGQQ